MVELYLHQKEVDGKIFYYVEVGSETHGRPTYIKRNNKGKMGKDWAIVWLCCRRNSYTTH
jgi:hypothetical protein